MKYFSLLILIACLLHADLTTAQPKPLIAKEPAWATINTIDYTRTTLDKNAQDGYMDISFEKQVNLAEQSRYIRRSKKIISKTGVQNGSEITVSYEPAYEQLLFHTIRIIRKNETINKLELSKLKVLHQEQERTSFIYNGTLDVVMVLEDVRQGDIVEYSFTIKGANPIFNNKYSDEYSMNFGVPIYQVYYKLIVPQGRKINFKYLNQPPATIINSINGQQVYEWRNNNIPGLVMQDYAPSWYDPYSQVLVSEFNNWKEVNDWAMQLFPVNKPLSASLQKKISEIEQDNADDAGRIQAALRFVQDDIRYMGIEIGINSHKPADPSKVFNQRFGDCKEKSYLLCCMLNAMHISASPVLINTSVKKNLHSLLPAPTSFDHVTIRVSSNNKTYWFDPTIAYQRGNLQDIFYPDYQAGLVVSAATDSLTTIPFRNVNASHVKEHFKVKGMAGEGTLIVTSTFRGSEADDIRSSFNSESIPEKMTSYQKFYAGYYEDIIADSLTYKDDDSTGVFTAIEYYTIPTFWTVSKENVKKFLLSPFIVNSLINKPKEKQRNMPFRLIYPVKCTEEIIVDLPQEWKVTEYEQHIKNSNCIFNTKFYCVFNQVHLDTDYENLKDHGTPAEATAYFKDLNEFDENSSFDITYGAGTSNTKDAGLSVSNVLTSLLILGAMVAGIVWFGKKGRV